MPDSLGNCVGCGQHESAVTNSNCCPICAPRNVAPACDYNHSWLGTGEVCPDCKYQRGTLKRSGIRPNTKERVSELLDSYRTAVERTERTSHAYASCQTDTDRHHWHVALDNEADVRQAVESAILRLVRETVESDGILAELIEMHRVTLDDIKLAWERLIDKRREEYSHTRQTRGPTNVRK